MYISENHKKQGDFKMTDYAPGMRAVIRDEEKNGSSKGSKQTALVIKFYIASVSPH